VVLERRRLVERRLPPLPVTNAVAWRAAEDAKRCEGVMLRLLDITELILPTGIGFALKGSVKALVGGGGTKSSVLSAFAPIDTCPRLRVNALTLLLVVALGGGPLGEGLAKNSCAALFIPFRYLGFGKKLLANFVDLLKLIIGPTLLCAVELLLAIL
jgi:hypothetical protein